MSPFAIGITIAIVQCAVILVFAKVFVEQIEWAIAIIAILEAAFLYTYVNLYLVPLWNSAENTKDVVTWFATAFFPYYFKYKSVSRAKSIALNSLGKLREKRENERYKQERIERRKRIAEEDAANRKIYLKSHPEAREYLDYMDKYHRRLP